MRAFIDALWIKFHYHVSPSTALRRRVILGKYAFNNYGTGVYSSVIVNVKGMSAWIKIFVLKLKIFLLCGGNNCLLVIHMSQLLILMEVDFVQYVIITNVDL